jgi:hypothetical protein
MNGMEMMSNDDVAEVVSRERDSMLEELRDLVVQDVAFLARAKSEGFDARASVRLAVTSETSDGECPVLAVQGGSAGLPDLIFPKLSKGYVVHYQAATRSASIEGEASPELGQILGPNAVLTEGGE